MKSRFNGGNCQAVTDNPAFSALSWITGLFFLCCAGIYLSQPLLAVVCALLSYLLLPPGYLFIEYMLRYRLTTKIKSVACAILLLVAILLWHYYRHSSRVPLLQRDTIALYQARQSRDSFDFYLNSGNVLKTQGRTEQAKQQLDHALSFASSQEDRNIIAREYIATLHARTSDLMQAGKYTEALPELNKLIAQDADNPDLFYDRAVCYTRMGSIREAVNDCRIAMQYGNDAAMLLHDSINPVLLKRTHYTTKCCDGTVSDTNGSDACQHHGGVCGRKMPVHEMYRRYK